MTKEQHKPVETSDNQAVNSSADTAGGEGPAGNDPNGPLVDGEPRAQAVEPATSAPKSDGADDGPGLSASRQTDSLEEDLRLSLEQAQRKADGHWEAVLRAQAELENLRKRSERDIENAHKYALDRFVSELLPVKDSMELGLGAASGDGVAVAQVREGIELTLKLFRTAMEKFGVEEIDPQDAVFDPERHQAMSVQESDSKETGTVLTVVQKGYLLNGRLVRPAMVIVAK